MSRVARGEHLRAKNSIILTNDRYGLRRSMEFALDISKTRSCIFKTSFTDTVEFEFGFRSTFASKEVNTLLAGDVNRHSVFFKC